MKYLCPIAMCKWQFSPENHYITTLVPEAERQYVELYIRGHLAGTHKIDSASNLNSREAYGQFKTENLGYTFVCEDDQIRISLPRLEASQK